MLSSKFLTLITTEHHPAKMGKMFVENLELFSTCHVGWQAHLLHAQCCIPFSQNQVISRAILPACAPSLKPWSVSGQSKLFAASRQIASASAKGIPLGMEAHATKSTKFA